MNFNINQKDMDDVDILGVDLGVYNTKTSRGYLTRSMLTSNTDYNIHSNGTLEINNTRCLVGTGRFDTEIVKSRRDNLPLLLYALTKSTTSRKVKLVLGLPNYQLQQDEYVDELKEKFTGSFEFTADGQKRNIEILEVRIFPEGVGAYYTITKNLSDKEVVLIDIGGSTFNMIWFSNNELIKVETLPFGSLNLLSDIREKVMSIHGGRVDIEMISKYIQRGRVGKTDDVMPYIKYLAQPYIDKLKNTLDLNFPIGDAEYYLCGGGVTLFADCIIDNLGDLNLISDYLFANANGFEKIGRVIFNG